MKARIFQGIAAVCAVALAVLTAGCADSDWLYDDGSFGQGQQVVRAQETLNREAYRLQTNASGIQDGR